MTAETPARPLSVTTPFEGPVHRSCTGLREQTVRIWAQALYCSPLAPSDRPDPQAVCLAVVEQLAALSEVAGGCTALVAQDAGDYPSGFRRRIAWCLRTADHAYTTLLAANAADRRQQIADFR